MFVADYDPSGPESITRAINWFREVREELNEVLLDIINQKQTEVVLRRREVLQELIQGATDAEREARKVYDALSHTVRWNFERSKQGSRK